MDCKTECPQKLNDAIKKVLNNLDVCMDILQIMPDTIKNNYVSQIVSIYIDGNDKNGESVKLKLIAKLEPTSGISFNEEIKLKFNREIYIYERVMSTFQKIQEDRKVTDPFKSYPKYYASFDEEVIILENMTELGYKTYDIGRTLNYNQASLLLTELGKFHALSFVLREENKDLFDEFYRDTVAYERDESYAKEMQLLHEHWYDGVLNTLKENNVVYTQFLKLRDRVSRYTYSFDLSSIDTRYAVIGHCDCWIPNLLFKHTDAESDDCPSDVCILDWQISTRSSPAVDVSQVLYCCCDHDLRKDHHENLIKIYYNSFSSFLSQFQLKSDKLFPFQVFQEHLKMFSVFGLSTSIVTNSLCSYYGIQDVHDDLKKNIPIIDVFAQYKRNEKLTERMKDVLLDHLMYGYDI